MQSYWPLGPFEKVDAANPCLGPQATTIFDCPLAAPVAWVAHLPLVFSVITEDPRGCPSLILV